MLPSFQLMLLALGWLQCICRPANAQQVVRLPVKRRDVLSSLGKRGPFAISLDNYAPAYEYYVTALIGTPPQDTELVLDTGSADIWMFGPGSCDQKTSLCQGGSFNISDSRTAKYVPNGRGEFQILYVSQGSLVRGDYFRDNLGVGGVTVKDLVMAVATYARYVPSGIMGIGLSSNEASVSAGLGRYPNFPDQLVKQGKIKSKAYSLYLDDIGSSTGMMIFGGYDEAKFSGELTMLPIQADGANGQRSSFAVSWTSLGIASSEGDFEVVQGKGILYPAVLDSGTTLTYMPSSIYASLASFFQVIPRGGGQPDLIYCNYAENNPGQLIYGFGGPKGPQIAVEFDELIVPLYSNGHQATSPDGLPLCAFGIIDAGDSPILFGQTFLRSAYVLYDLENLHVGLAQTVFDSVESRVIEYDGLPAPRINKVNGPQVTASVSGAMPTIIGTSVPPGPKSGFGYASFVSTDYPVTSVSYPSETPPAKFPTTIPSGPTSRLPISVVNQQPRPTHSGDGDGNGHSGGSQGDTSGNGNKPGKGDENSGVSFSRPSFAAYAVVLIGFIGCLALL